jgi:hypothetical protein
MAEAGGSSTISGVGYEQWAFAYFMAKALLDDSDIISMSSQKNRALPKTNDGEIESIAIDDLVIEYSTRTDHLNIKQHATSGHWNTSELQKPGVLTSIKGQYINTPKRNIYLVTQSDSPILRELARLTGATSRKDIEHVLSPLF